MNQEINDLTPENSHVRFHLEEVSAIIPSVINEKCLTVILKSGYSFDVWKQTAEYIVSNFDAYHNSKRDGYYISVTLPGHTRLDDVLPIKN